MIDTVRLLIPREQVSYVSGALDWELYSKTEQYAKYVRNPTKAMKDTGLIFPRLTGYKRRFGDDANVLIEFSAPKLLYLNNLDELEDEDFPELIKVLRERLRTMGISILSTALENASVSAIHFSKNILLKNGYTSSHLISEMNKVDLRKSFDFTRSRYINDGESIHAHTKAHELVIYDKVADLAKDKKRAIDKDQTLNQLGLFDELMRDKELKEVIRFEVRLGQKQKMNSVLEELGYEKNPTFKDVFRTEISKKVMNDYWQKLIKERNLGIFSISISIKDILRTLFLADRTLKPKQAIYLLGLFLLAKDDKGMRELRSVVSKRARQETWYRIAKDMRESSQLITKNKIRDWVSHIDEALENYEPFKAKKNEQ